MSILLVRDPLHPSRRQRLRRGEWWAVADAGRVRAPGGAAFWRGLVLGGPRGQPAELLWQGRLHARREEALELAEAVLAGRLRSAGGPRPWRR